MDCLSKISDGTGRDGVWGHGNVVLVKWIACMTGEKDTQKEDISSWSPGRGEIWSSCGFRLPNRCAPAAGITLGLVRLVLQGGTHPVEREDMVRAPLLIIGTQDEVFGIDESLQS
jgi:hypothetical protein